jgi:hypothetical protein
LVLETDAPDIPPHWLYVAAQERAQGVPQGRNTPGQIPSIAQVLADLQARQVLLLRADWTRRDPAITQALAELGRSGVPVYALFAPGKPPQLLPEVLSVAALKAALAAL